jgi:hypothetical protein
MNYRLCNANRLLDMGAQFANLDPSFIIETLTRQITVGVSSGNSQMVSDAMSLLSLDPNRLAGKNMWELGQSVGRLAKAMLDFNINN